MTTIGNRLQDILARIHAIQSTSDCKQLVSLLAVSKAQSPQAVREAYASGQTLFGENYLQEALEKQEQLKDLKLPPI